MLNSEEQKEEIQSVSLTHDLRLAISQLGGTVNCNPIHEEAIESLNRLLAALSEPVLDS